jgi:hypothetical protein
MIQTFHQNNAIVEPAEAAIDVIHAARRARQWRGGPRLPLTLPEVLALLIDEVLVILQVCFVDCATRAAGPDRQRLIIAWRRIDTITAAVLGDRDRAALQHAALDKLDAWLREGTMR